MSHEDVFYLIRSGKVVLWAGAGFSLYAGYPNAKSLGEKFVRALTPDQQKQFQAGQSLETICEQYVRMNGNNRKPLIDLLKKTFSKRPTSLEFHKKLALIPHIQ